MSTTDRRTLIAEAAVDLIATAGLRALTHRALDTALDLPAGSTSYYFRTRRALLDAVADHLTDRSRADFLATAAPRDLTVETVARDVADRLDRTLTTRRHHLIARQALLVDPLPEPDLRARLARSLFSPERATADAVTTKRPPFPRATHSLRGVERTVPTASNTKAPSPVTWITPMWL